MGLCRDFGSQIAEGCDHLMLAGSDSCHCEACAVVCTGLFGGCASVWALGPQSAATEPEPPDDLLPAPPVARHTNGAAHHEPGTPDAPSADSDTDAPAREGEAAPATNRAGHGPPPSSAHDPGSEYLRWFQTAFDVLRLEVEGLRSALSREQGVVAALLESRSRDAGLDAESLRALVSTTVSKAVRRETAELGSDLIATVATLRRDLDGVRVSHDEQDSHLQASIAAAMAAVEADIGGVRASVAAVLDRLTESEASLASSLAEVNDSLTALAAARAEAPEVDAAPPAPDPEGHGATSGPTPRGAPVRFGTSPQWAVPRPAGSLRGTRVSLRKRPLDG